MPRQACGSSAGIRSPARPPPAVTRRAPISSPAGPGCSRRHRPPTSTTPTGYDVCSSAWTPASICSTADDHDRLFALISHLPQLAVSALMDVVGAGAGADGLALAGTGLRDTTRLAASPPGIWRDIIQTNHAHIAPAIDALIDTLTRLRDDESGKELQGIFERAAAAQRRLGELDRRPPMKNGPL